MTAAAVALLVSVLIAAGMRAWLERRCERAGHKWNWTDDGVFCRRCGYALRLKE